MSSRLPRLPGGEPIDLRAAGLFMVLTIALVVPGIANALSPVGDEKLNDAASTLESQAREAIGLIEHREGTTDLAFSSELQDLAATARQVRDDLLRQAVEPTASATRDRVADAARGLSDADDDASRAGADRSRLERDRAALQQVAAALHDLAGAS